MSFNWNDLKFLIELHREGHIAKVAENFGIDPTTVSRRIKAMENSLGVKLLQRIDGQYYATDALKQALPQAELAEQQLKLFEDKLMAGDKQLSGTIRITSVHTFVNHYLLAKLPNFYQQYPEISIELIADSRQLDLNRHEADIAIRMGRPEQSSIVTRRIAILYYSIYAHSSLVALNPDLKSMSESKIEETPDLTQLPWILLDSQYANLPEAIWQQQHFPQAKANLFCNVGPAMLNAVKNRLGIACLPCYMGEVESELEHLYPPFPLRELWLLMHQEKRHVARIRAFIDWLEMCLLADQAIFQGSVEGK